MENNKILVIDDNEDILFMLKAMLQLKEYKVFTKETADNIESYIQELMPDVILMDMLLSGIDGCEVCRKIKSIRAIAAIPVIMMSALPEAKALCVEAGANYFVGKPFEMADLFNAVFIALSQKELSEA
ncbi:MAG TPA: response regulator [Ferruginibacter sp.]|jgi:DNA-binding response OmpR family regulator|nr:response regulator [Ferruginibacter sp.]